MTLVTAISGLPPLAEKEFRHFRDFIHRETGILLGPHKKALLVNRIGRRLRELGLDRFGRYWDLVQSDPAERTRMIERICTHETCFFREPRQFELLEQRLIPHWREQARLQGGTPRVRVWSAGCSTGEEPFSIAMTLLHGLPGWDAEVLATDLSGWALERARSATWPARRSREIPSHLLKRFMLKGVRSQEGWIRASAELRQAVRFEQVNLNAAAYPFDTRFDAIFCRNVLIYLDPAARVRVIHRLLDFLSPSGHLFLGHSESLIGVTDRARAVMPTVYVLAGART